MQQSLFGDLSRPSKQSDIAIAKKSKSVRKAPTTAKGSGLLSKIEFIRKFVEEHLGKYRDEYLCIRDTETLHNYVDTCIQDGRLALDTETTGLNVFRDKIVGISLHSKNNKPAYIPINHVDYFTMERISNQLTAEQIRPELERMFHLDCDMFNAAFDRRVLIHNIGTDFPCTWDASIASRMMNENEPKGMNKLKPLHAKYVLNGEEDEFSFGDIFNDVGFDKVPIDVATLYAAHDAVITTEFADFQRKYLYYDPTKDSSDRNGMNGVAWTFFNIEMPCIDCTIEMEENGIRLDKEYNQALSEKYHKIEDGILEQFYKELEPYEPQLDSLRLKGVKLDNPLNINSNPQLAVLIYDVLKVGEIDKKKPRGTGEEILTKIDHPIIKRLMEYRKVEKLISTYIDKMPDCVEYDGKVHGKFNQYGADTGRYSSQDPNMQNIPSHNKDIRKMFTASEGCLLMSADFSQQEPKALAALCKQMGDPQMYDTFMEGKDIYAEIASKSFHKEYKECLEHFPKGTKIIKSTHGNWYYSPDERYDKIADGEDVYKEGQERRSQAKTILLGVLYGRGEDSIAEQLECSIAEAQAIKNSVFKGFPAIKRFEKESLDFAYENGYVTTVCGRKRRLPNLMLNEYDFKWVDDTPRASDALDFDDTSDEVPYDIQDKWWDKLMKAKPWDKKRIFEQANRKDGVWIIDNGKKIADATRQCVNSRIQGSAADLTKLAMIDICSNKVLKKLGFKLLLQIHDEVIGECPKENIKECSRLLAEIMSKAAEKILEMPIKCDVEITECWYGERIEV